MGKVATANGYVKVWAPEHPLRGIRGEVLEHRMVLFDAIGPGSHPCHWCGRELIWRVRRGEPPRVTDLVVDHLDGNRANNALENLVPSCQPCNVSAGYGPTHIRDDEMFRIRGNGAKLRAKEFACGHCGETFLREESAVMDHATVYCSRKCANAGLRRAVCRRGHPRTGDNVTKYGQCRECSNLACRRHRAKKRAAKE